MSEVNPAAGDQSDADAVYIGDAERAEATQLLGEHFREGRLQAEEYGERVQIAVGARTRGELRALFANLPQPWPSSIQPVAPPSPTTYFYPALPQQFVGMSDKSKVVAGVLQIVLPFGVGRFYVGNTGLGVAQLLCTVLTCGVGALWSFIDGIILLTAGGTDQYGRQLH